MVGVSAKSSVKKGYINVMKEMYDGGAIAIRPLQEKHFDWNLYSGWGWSGAEVGKVVVDRSKVQRHHFMDKG